MATKNKMLSNFLTEHILNEFNPGRLTVNTLNNEHPLQWGKINFEFIEYYFSEQSGGLNKGTLNLLIK